MGKTKQKAILIHLPEPWIIDLDLLVKTGMYPNRNEAVRVAVRDLLRVEVWHARKRLKHHPLPFSKDDRYDVYHRK